MANKFVTLDAFRKGIVNKRSNPDYASLDEQLIPGRYKAISATQYCYVLDECIYNEDITDFKVYYKLNEQEIEITNYTVNTTSAVITFDNGYDPRNQNLYCKYTGGGSIIWVEDVTDLQRVVTDIDANTVYIDGSNYMTGDLKMGEGTTEHPYKSIVNVNLVDGIDVSAHNHTGNTNGSLIPTNGIENSAIVEAKIANSAVTNQKIKDAAVTNNKISAETITANKFNSTMIGAGLKRTTASGVANSVLQVNVDNSSIILNNGVMQVPLVFNLIGIVVPFAGDVAPQGWLLCDGKEYNVTQYSNLFQVIRYKYGGSGSTFRVPDFRGKTFWGGDETNVGTVLAAGLPNIKGSFKANDFVDNRAVPTVSGAIYTEKWTGREAEDGTGNTNCYKLMFDASRSSAIYSDSVQTVQPPAIQTMFIIKY